MSRPEFDLPADPASAEPAETADPAALAEGDTTDEADGPTEVSVDVPPGTDLAGPIEALLLMAEEPVPATTLAVALDVPVEEVTDCLDRLVRFYDETSRGFELRHLGGGWRYYTRAEHADVIAAFVLSGQTARLSQAALETLSVIAYTQPISRSRVAAVRGVNVDGVIRTLLARNLVEEAGQDSETGAVVFRTTDYFLERMGLDSLDDLPDLAPYLPETADLEAELGELARRPPPGPTSGDSPTSEDSPTTEDRPNTDEGQASGGDAQLMSVAPADHEGDR